MVAHVFGGLDEAVWRFWAGLDLAWVHSAARVVSGLGTQTVLLPAAVFAGIAIWIGTRRVLPALAPWFAVQIDAILVSRLKVAFEVERPPRDQMVRVVRSAAFPSGHAANTTALLVAVAVVVGATGNRDARARAVLLAMVGALAMGWSRLALNVHWLSDVVGGTVIGALVGFGTARLMLWPGGHRTGGSGGD